MSTKFVGIYSEIISSSIEKFIEVGKLVSAPLVVYTINEECPNTCICKRPFEIFKKDMSMKDVRNLTCKYSDSISFLQIPNKSYTEMIRYIYKNLDKVVADLVSIQINSIIGNYPDDEIVFFIHNLNSDKLIGRLSYLYLDSDKYTFAFVSYKTESLLTTTISQSETRLQFDIDHFLQNPHKKHSDTIPNDFMESLTQTVFFSLPAPKERNLLPLRIDVYSQGISKKLTDEKIELIENILQNPVYLSPPFMSSCDTNAYHRIPLVLYDSIEAAKYFGKNIKDQLLEDRG